MNGVGGTEKINCEATANRKPGVVELAIGNRDKISTACEMAYELLGILDGYRPIDPNDGGMQLGSSIADAMREQSGMLDGLLTDLKRLMSAVRGD